MASYHLRQIHSPTMAYKAEYGLASVKCSIFSITLSCICLIKFGKLIST